MSTATLERPTDVQDPEKDRMAHYPQDPLAPFPKPALCGWICTRHAPADSVLCSDCAAIHAAGGR